MDSSKQQKRSLEIRGKSKSQALSLGLNLRARKKRDRERLARIVIEYRRGAIEELAKH